MRPAPHPRTVLIVAVCLYLVLLVIGFAGAALGQGLLEPLLAMVGLAALLAP